MALPAGARPATFLATTKKDEARDFFENKLGLKFITDDGFAMVFDNCGSPLRISPAKEFTPQQFTVLGWTVADVRAAVDELQGRGVQFEHYDFMPPGEVVFTFPGPTDVAWFKDPDGNVLSLNTKQ